MGKTHLAQQLLVEARLAGANVLRGQCFQTDTSLPYRPFTEILRDYLRENPGVLSPPLAADLVKLMPELASEYEIEQLPSISPDAERLRLFEHVTQLIIQISRKTPLILLLEDLHWGDPSRQKRTTRQNRHDLSNPGSV